MNFDFGVLTTITGLVADIIGIIAFIFGGEKWKKSTKIWLVFFSLVFAVGLALVIGNYIKGGGASSESSVSYYESYEPTVSDGPVSDEPVSSGFTPINAEVGQTIFYGNYKQGANGEISPIEWRVLSIRNDRALLVSEKLLDYVKYNETLTSVTWESCTLREWLNGTFKRKAFTESELRRIPTVTNVNPDNAKYGTRGGNNTEDTVFLLSRDEADMYFSNDRQRVAYSTAYAHSKGYDAPDGSSWWWLRSPGSTPDSAAGVYYNGSFFKKGDHVDDHDIAVRPAIWLILE